MSESRGSEGVSLLLSLLSLATGSLLQPFTKMEKTKAGIRLVWHKIQCSILRTSVWLSTIHEVTKAMGNPHIISTLSVQDGDLQGSFFDLQYHSQPNEGAGENEAPALNHQHTDIGNKNHKEYWKEEWTSSKHLVWCCQYQEKAVSKTRWCTTIC